MTVCLTRSSAGHGGSGQWLGVEVDDNGHASSWQASGGSAGRFGRDLSPKERTALKRALTVARNAAAGGGQLQPAAPEVVRPEGSTERLSADGLATLELDPHEDPPKGVASLLRFLRKLMGDLVESPVAAIALEVDGAPLRARLRHVGSEPVQVRLGPMTVEGHLFGKGDAIVDSTSLSLDGPAESTTVDAGWTFDLGDDLGIDAPKHGQFLVVRVELDVDAGGDGVLRRARLGRTVQ